MSYARTEKPCPGCGEAAYIKVGEICRYCREDLEYAKKKRQEEAENLKNSEKQIYLIEYGYRISHYANIPTASNRRFYELREKLREVFARLIRLEQSPIPGDVSYRPDYRQLPTLFGYKQGSSTNSEGVILPKAYGDSLNELYSLIGEFGQECYQSGYQSGQNLLTQLASGEMGVEKFNRLSAGQKE